MRKGSIRLAAPVALTALRFAALGLATPLLRDDSTLGYFTGKRAAYIVVEEPGYGEAFRGFAAIDPALGRFLQKTLNQDCQKVCTNSVYEIYARR